MLANLFKVSSWWDLLFILIAKVIEVSITTLRIILMNKGFRKQATILSFFEILLWVFIASTVLNGISDEPIKGLVYAIGYTLGIFVGSLVEKLLAFGKVFIQVIIPLDKEKLVVDVIRSNNYAVTTLAGKGKESEKAILLIFANRKGQNIIINKVYDVEPEAMIVSNDVVNIRGGYIKGLKK